jgi:hypothetical protein
MWKWLILTCCLFAGFNWFVLPNFPAITEYSHALSLGGAFGLAGIIMMVGLVFGKK